MLAIEAYVMGSDIMTARHRRSEDGAEVSMTMRAPPPLLPACTDLPKFDLVDMLVIFVRHFCIGGSGASGDGAALS